MTTDFPRWYPKAVKRNITPGANDPIIQPVLVSFHVAASNTDSLFGFFNGPSGGIESHLYLRKDGTWEQYRAFDREADAQLGGNSWRGLGEKRLGSVTIETQGLGGGWWTRKQKAALKEFALWAHEHLGIPLRQVQSPNPMSLLTGGFGYHSLFPEWNTLGKTCPGPRRIAWFARNFRPWLREQNGTATFRDSDTLATFAARHGITVERLWLLNRAAPRVGDKMWLR